MPRLESRAAFARLAGVSKMAITKACGGALKAACVGQRLDLDHPAAKAYLAGKGKAAETPPADDAPTEASETASERPPRPTVIPPTPGARATPRVPRAPAIPRTPEDLTSVDISALLHLTLDELTERYGTSLAVKDWLDARKKISDIREKDLKNAETEGRLVERELVKTHVFGALEAANLRILSDAPKTITRRLYAAAKSGTSIEEAEAVVRSILSDLLRPVKIKAARALRDGQ